MVNGKMGFAMRRIDIKNGDAMAIKENSARRLATVNRSHVSVCLGKTVGRSGSCDTRRRGIFVQNRATAWGSSFRRNSRSSKLTRFDGEYMII